MFPKTTQKSTEATKRASSTSEEKGQSKGAKKAQPSEFKSDATAVGAKTATPSETAQADKQGKSRGSASKPAKKALVSKSAVEAGTSGLRNGKGASPKKATCKVEQKGHPAMLC